MQKFFSGFMVFIIPFFIVSCLTFELEDSIGDDTETSADDLTYRNYMRQFVQDISKYGKGLDADFIIIPQNGHALLTSDGNYSSPVSQDYIDAIDGLGREDLFYGYDSDDTATESSDTREMIYFMDIAEANGIQTIITDYCETQSYMDDSYEQNYNKGYISFAADHRELDNIPTYPISPNNANSNDIVDLNDAKNFLYLLNPDSYSTKSEFLSALAATDYDMFIMDLYFDGEALTSADLEQIQTKASGGSRLLISYMSIGEAEDYRYYWESEWSESFPSWIETENPDWPGNYKVKYWDNQWENIIFGNDTSYLKKIIDVGFDGVYLDIIDAYEYFEE
ncbi:MAG: endo alpha-1,4 polygalactosaminidase [Pseudomonadota bacterium]